MGDNKVICVGKETEMVWSCAEETRGQIGKRQSAVTTPN